MALHVEEIVGKQYELHLNRENYFELQTNKSIKMNINRIILSLIVIMGSINCVAQNKFNAELSLRRIFVSNVDAPNVSYSNKSTSGNSIRVLFGYHINNFLNVNAGMGLDHYIGDFDTNTIPVVANIKYSLKGQPQGLFFMVEGGPQVRFSDSADKGYMFLSAVGYKFKLSNLIRLNITSGYNFQKSTEGFSSFDDNVKRQGFFIGTSISL